MTGCDKCDGTGWRPLFTSTYRCDCNPAPRTYTDAELVALATEFETYVRQHGPSQDARDRALSVVSDWIREHGWAALPAHVSRWRARHGPLPGAIPL